MGFKSGLKKLTGKKHFFLTDRGNTALLLSLKLAKQLGKIRVNIQDQGGWITYIQYIKKLKLEIKAIDTDCGLIKLSLLKKIIDKKSVLLMNSMPGYFALQENMKEIFKLCRERDCFLINDVSGSIGTHAAKYGELIVGSFGRWKPLELNYGGFIGYDNPEHGKFFAENMKKEVRDFKKELEKALKLLPSRIKSMHERTQIIKKQLSDFDIIHRNKYGYNIIVRFKSDEEKMKLMDFCKLKGYEFTLCPRYIRVMEDAVCIELKRI